MHIYPFIHAAPCRSIDDTQRDSERDDDRHMKGDESSLTLPITLPAIIAHLLLSKGLDSFPFRGEDATGKTLALFNV